MSPRVQTDISPPPGDARFFFRSIACPISGVRERRCPPVSLGFEGLLDSHRSSSWREVQFIVHVFVSQMRLPLVSIPARTGVWPLGSTPAAGSPPLLRFANALTIPSDGDYGLAIVGEGEGRRRLVQVCPDNRADTAILSRSLVVSCRLCCQSIDSTRSLLRPASSHTYIIGRNSRNCPIRQPRKNLQPLGISRSQSHRRQANSQTTRLAMVHYRKKTKTHCCNSSKNRFTPRQRMKR